MLTLSFSILYCPLTHSPLATPYVFLSHPLDAIPFLLYSFLPSSSPFHYFPSLLSLNITHQHCFPSYCTSLTISLSFLSFLPFLQRSFSSPLIQLYFSFYLLIHPIFLSSPPLLSSRFSYAYQPAYLPLHPLLYHPPTFLPSLHPSQHL